MGKRLLHITTVPQSLYYFLVGQAAYMQSMGLEVQAISSPGPLLQEFSAREGVRCFPLEMKRAISPFRDLWTLLRLCWRLLRLRPHIVHAHTPKAGLLGMLAAFICRVPVRVYHVHGSPYVTARGWQRLLIKTTERISCALAQRVLVVSDSVRREFIRGGLCSGSKSKVLGCGSINGVDALRHFNPECHDRLAVRTELGVPEEALVIGFVGRLVRDKGICELIDAWQSLRKDLANLYLLLIGGVEQRDGLPGDVLAAIERDERILWLGEIKDPAKYYAAMDVFCLPTYREGLPLVPLEAQAMGIPVVATRVMGCVDAIEDGVTGTLVPPRDAVALAIALRTYLGDARLRRQHGQAGRSKMLRDFSPQSVWERQYAEYAALLKARGMTP